MKIRSILSTAVVWGALAPAAALAQLHVFTAVPLIGTEEVPPVIGNGFGAITAIYDEDSNTLFYDVEWRLGDNVEATAGHFHGPAPKGSSAGAQVNLGAIAGESGRVRGSATLSSAQEAELLSGQWYVNVHSNQHPNGEIRGQMVEHSPLDNRAVFDTVEGKLRLETVMVPGLGVFDAELEMTRGLPQLVLELSSAAPKASGSASGGGQ